MAVEFTNPVVLRERQTTGVFHLSTGYGFMKLSLNEVSA